MVASTSLNASVELARAIASMHTILQTCRVIARALDDHAIRARDGWAAVFLGNGQATPRSR